MSKNAKYDFSETTVAYPTAEKAYAIICPDNIPFTKAIVGITMPLATYRINRKMKANMTVFEYVTLGAGRIFIDGKWHTAEAGDFYILSQGEEHKYQSVAKNPWKKLWINYSAAYIPSLLAAYGVKSGVYRSDAVKPLFEELISITKTHNGDGDIFYLIADTVHAIIREASRSAAGSFNEGDIMKHKISAYVHKKFNLSAFADELHMSKSNVIRAFKKHHGVTPYEYILNLKIETAKALLSSTSLTVKKISEKLSIYDEHYFSTLFFKRTGKRPRDYRAENEAKC